MPCRDFFAFCTSLTKVELRAIGALSQVQHLGDGDTIYRPGEPGDMLYIVNRGTVELSKDASRGPICLGRGGIFGEAEALTGATRKHRARTFEPTSLQCFPRDNLSALAERVPTFFQYLCEELATRYLLACEGMAAAATEQLELSGSLSNFDLVTVYQTIVNSSQTGELSIASEKGELICTFFFEAGQPRSAQFQHLVGEEAFWQLFLAESLHGTFSFSSGQAKVTPTIKGEITRSPNDMLITALQSRDEFHALQSEMGDPASVLWRNRPQLAIDEIDSVTLRPLVDEIWRLRQKRELRLQDLYRHFAVCELKVYQAVHALVATGHCALSADNLAQKVA